MTTLTPDIIVVSLIIALALVLFTTERIPIDMTAILIMVTLIVFEPWTHITVRDGISGFSNPATITVLAMLILSAGISNTGIVQRLGHRLAAYAGTNPRKQLAVTIAVAGPSSGFINNTPVVALLVPIITDLAHRGKTSPSRLLMPLSFASMLGGTLTLIGTSTNILASDVSDRLLGHPFSMFEFTALGVIVLVVGTVYLVTIGDRLLPERIEPQEDYITEYKLDDYLAEFTISPESALIDRTITEAFPDEIDVDVLQLDRGGTRYIERLAPRRLRPNDIIKVRANRDTLQTLLDQHDITPSTAAITDTELQAEPPTDQTLVEVVIPSGSPLVGQTLRTSGFRQRYDANVLAFRSRGELIRDRLDRTRIRIGDTLLVQAPQDSIDRLAQNPDFIVAHEPLQPQYRTAKAPHAIAIMLGVVLLPALDILPIVVSALAGVVGMALLGVLQPTELYDAVDWNVIFLLAGVIPLGMALERSGAADIVGTTIATSASVLPAIAVLWVFYTVTALLTNAISNNASVVLMIPIAVEAAFLLNVNPFAFVLAVTFAASTAFITPISYQTNLFVYGPGGYRFTDYFRVGAPLQLILSVTTVLGIALLWPL